jgi:SNF2 family DNA or RNA helicase
LKCTQRLSLLFTHTRKLLRILKKRMSTLHGSWIENQYFFIWGEVWRTVETETLSLESSSEEISRHPFNLTIPELLSFLRSHSFDVPKLGTEKVLNITLPSYKPSRKKYTLPLLSSQIDEEAFSKTNFLLQPWQVEGQLLTPLEAVNFFSQVTLGEVSYLGQDLRFWSHVYRWILDLLARGKYLPSSLSQTEENILSYWYPLLDSTLDQARFAKFTQAMPLICKSYSLNETKEKYFDNEAILLSFLRQILDAKIRTILEPPTNLPKNLEVLPWLQSLTQKSNQFQIPENYIKRLNHALDNWTLSIQDYLVTPDNKQLSQNRFRVCFVLEPPSPDIVDYGDANWSLNYYLQALDDSDILIDARLIWQILDDSLFFQGREINHPQETLLKGLGLASRLYEPIANSLLESQPIKCEFDPIQVYQFIKSIAWQLQDKGMGVILPPGLALGNSEKRLGIKIEAEVTPKKGERLSLKSLLNYNLKVVAGDAVISKQDFEKLLQQRSPIVKVDEQWLMLQPTDVKAAQEILNQTYETINLSVEDALRMSIGDSNIIAKLPVVNFEASGVLKNLINNLMDNQSIEPIEKPAGFQGELRPYQAKGVGWLAFLEKWGLGACLADDMGLGKTPQLIAFLLNLKEQEMLVKPTLVVCPTSVVSNWEREVHKFAPTLSTIIHHGNQRKKGKTFAREIKDKTLVITSYPLIYRDAETLTQIEWQGIVLDEAQNIKNPQAKQSQAVRDLKAGFHIALTGTPVENRLGELWSILDFLNPGFLGSQSFFQRRFAIPIEKYGDRESLKTLRSLVRPFILRRLKTDREIIQDLPEKQEMNVFCGLSEEQANLYQNLVDQSLLDIEEKTGIQRRGLILSLLVKLKQICNHPAHFLKEDKVNSAQRSGKMLRLVEMLEELLAEGDRALIFTQFAEWGKLMQTYLTKVLGKETLFLYGQISQKQRQEMIDRFQNDPNGPPIFILSLKAGGTGLNLTRANHVFHVDRWWNPAVENQATDRAFRIGQKRNVQVHKFVCTGTLEEKINDMIESKKQLAEQTVDAGENWLTELDTDQLRNLLLLDRNAIIDE